MLYFRRTIHEHEMWGLTMDCEKCGAEVPENAGTCPECGEPLAAVTTETAAADDAAPADAFSDEETAPDAPEEPVTGATEEKKPGALNKKAALIALAVLVVVVALGAVAFLVPIGGATLVAKLTNDPAAVAQRMIAAYAKYDAKGMLATTNSGAVSAADSKTFEQEAAKAKTSAKGKDGIRNFKVGKVTIDSKDSKRATVEISGEWLDTATGTYAQRADQLTMIQQNGKWVVQLF